MKFGIYPKRLLKTASIAVNKDGQRIIKIKLPFNREDINLVKSLPYRIYHKEDQAWSCPLTYDNVKKLAEWGFQIDEKLKDYIREKDTKLRNTIQIDIPGLLLPLRPFQKEFVKFAELHDGRVLNADDMGLGKTIEALAWLQLRQDVRPALIIVPASVKLNWRREANKWLPHPRTEILSGETPHKITGDIVIINYDVVQYWFNELKKRNFQIMILDEAHAIKNNQTNRTKMIKKLSKFVPRVMALTGTPVENSPIELFNPVSLINSAIFPDYWDFVWTYCDPKNTGFAWNLNGVNKEKLFELNKILTSTVMLRRLKQDVLSELPEKIRSIVPMDLTNREEYDFAERNFKAWVKETKGEASVRKIKFVEARVKIEYLKQIAIKGKMKGIIQWIKDFLETENKLVVVTTHTFVIDQLLTEFSDIALRYDGSMSDVQKQRAVDSFQNDPTKNLIVLNLISGGKGITLTAAASELIVELGWNPKLMDQVEDRVHRMGQTRGVNIYYGLAENTIEEKIAKKLDDKRKIADAIIDGIETEDESLLYELLKDYSK